MTKQEQAVVAELKAACETCVSTITAIVEQAQPRATTVYGLMDAEPSMDPCWVNLRAAGHLARRAVAMADEKLTDAPGDHEQYEFRYTDGSFARFEAANLRQAQVLARRYDPKVSSRRIKTAWLRCDEALLSERELLAAIAEAEEETQWATKPEPDTATLNEAVGRFGPELLMSCRELAAIALGGYGPRAIKAAVALLNRVDRLLPPCCKTSCLASEEQIKAGIKRPNGPCAYCGGETYREGSPFAAQEQSK
jgi:hypothetical protein